MSQGMSSRRAAVALATIVFVALALTASQAQEPKTPAFPAQAEAITVDAVVLDKDGRPIRGLTKSDFVVLEDGKPQEIVGFEARDLAQPRPETPATAAAGLPHAEAEEAVTPGRTLAFVVDDLGLDVRSKAAIDAIRSWILEKADPRDELTLVTTSGDVDWTGQVGTGRGEVLRKLALIRFRRPPLSFFTARAGDHGVPPPQTGVPVPDAPLVPSSGVTVLTEYKAYMIASHRASGPTQTAQEVYEWWRGRARAMVAAIRSFSEAHASQRGRKPIFIFSQGFIRDQDLEYADKSIDASQRANTALYFVDTRGLVAGERGGSNMFGDDVGEVATHIDLAGAEYMAAETGGAAVRDTNDLLSGLSRSVDESSAYYLLGYQPTKTPDGKWHKLEVRVDVKGVTLRSRRGYYASALPLSDVKAQQVAAAEVSMPENTVEPAEKPAAEARPAPQSEPAGPSAEEKAAEKVPAFSTRAEAITVDAVVVDKDDHPVKDLTKADFTLFEDGRPQTIVGFEPREVSSAGATTTGTPEGAATNETRAESGGRTLAFLVDDLGIEPLHMTETAKALTQWLDHGADPGDEVTLTTTSNDAWWSDTVGNGRADFGVILGRIKGQKKLATVKDAMSDWEAYSIETLGSPGDTPGEQPTVASGPPSAGASCSTNAEVSNIRDRVVDRWFRTGACLCTPMSIESSIHSCRSQVEGRARAVYQAATQRAVGLLGGIEGLSRGLEGARGRKSIIVLSESLLRDTQQNAFERAVDASRRGNTVVSFVDVRGLTGLSFLSAEQDAPPKGSEQGAMTMEETVLETAGGEYLAETTGGSTLRNNDLAGSLTRLADESSAYYLLGYQSDKPQDGKWHKVEVKVGRPGVKVHARRGYFATPPEPRVAAKADTKGKSKGKKKAKGGLPTRALDPALAVGGERDEIPLRVAPYVLDSDASGLARVLVAVEVGTTKLTYAGTGDGRTAQLDVTILGVSRDQPKTASLDSHVELKLDAKAVGGWWTFTRDLRLPSGPAQVRALVRDTATGRSGMVTERVVVPATNAAYISTPILSDRLVPPQGPVGVPKLVPAAHRRFQARGQLYCEYEVFVAPGGRTMREIPRVAGGFTIEDESGKVVESAAPTPIALALDAHLVRLLAIPLEGLAPGRYSLVIQTEDRATGQNLEARQAFSVEPPPDVEPKSD